MFNKGTYYIIFSNDQYFFKEFNIFFEFNKKKIKLKSL